MLERLQGTPNPLNVAFFANYDVNLFSDETARALQEADMIVSLGGVDLEKLAPLIPPQKKALCTLGPQDGREVAPFKSLHASGFKFRDWRIAGFSGNVRLGKSSGLYYSEREADTLLDSLPACDIFLSNSPPAGLQSSEQMGFQALEKYCKEKPPIFHFYAHPSISVDEEKDETLFVGVNGFLFPPPIYFN